ncbi:minor capsid protein [Cupriavidus metallidurans]|uniref:minor capsid protein n=1 Tax=Cupriavidus metallidurans TaxID=119219 RepID=UPI001CCD00CB|nr:minor capsid protein [Cupriavidus metallidurans]UBM12759.1 minor capsid protein [Cupriavidus metallidurans]
MILEILANKLEEAGFGKKGKDIFINSMPVQCHEGLLVRQTWEGLELDWELPGTHTGGIALISRASKFPKANDLASRAADALTVTSAVEIDDILLHYARPATSPIPYPQTDGGYVECATRIDLCFVV